MRINQEPSFKPLIIELQTKQEYDDFFRIVDEALDKNTPVFMTISSRELAGELSEFATNNT